MKTDNPVLAHPFTIIRMFEESKKPTKLLRDAWSCAIVLLTLRGFEGNEWWLKVANNKNIHADFHGVGFPRTTDETFVKVEDREMSVVEFGNGTKQDDFLSFVTKAVKKRTLTPKSTLVIAIKKQTELPPFNQIAQKIAETKTKLKDVWIVATTSPDTQELLVGSVYPTPGAATLDYKRICESQEVHSFLEGSENEVYKPRSDVVLNPDLTITSEKN